MKKVLSKYNLTEEILNSNKVSILIVEDEINILSNLVNCLSMFCNNIYQANNGLEAIKLYEQYLPNIILTDIKMPKLGGIEFVEMIRQKDQSTQIIIFSAYTKTEDFLRVVPLNLVSYLVKPINFDELVDKLFKAAKNISKDNLIRLNNDYFWNSKTKNLIYEDQIVELTSYENSFVASLVSKLDQQVSYEEIHYHIYDLGDYSQDAIFTLAKRIRKKTKKKFIQSCFKFGYKIESK